MESRSIKFRAWDKKFNKMRYNPLVPDTSFLNDCFKDERFILMQATGLEDKNGIEIYEHDFVRTHNDKLAKVVYKEGAFMLEFAEEGRPDDYLQYGFEMGIRIVGNIYGSK